jgi:hypothetical protein
VCEERDVMDEELTIRLVDVAADDRVTCDLGGAR